MARSTEIRYFANVLAGLVITAARATSDEQLVEIHKQIEETITDAFVLLSHDALTARELAEEAIAEAGSARERSYT